MEWKKTKNPIGYNAMILYNSAVGEISCDSAYRMFELGEGINELFNEPGEYGPGTLFMRNSGINEECGLWIENDQWYPIVKTKEDGLWMIMYYWFWEGSEQIHKNEELSHGYDICEKLMKIVREKLGGDTEEPDASVNGMM